MNPAFDKIFTLSTQCTAIFIAGGAVVDYEKATDIDLWFGKQNEKMANAFLQKCPISQLAPHKDYGTINLYGEAYIPGIPKLIQVMVASDKSPEDTLSTFDISTHQWAYTSRGKLIRGQQATTTSEPVRVLHSTPQTLGRYLKIAARYGLPIVESEILQFKQTAWPVAPKIWSKFLNTVPASKPFSWDIETPGTPSQVVIPSPGIGAIYIHDNAVYYMNGEDKPVKLTTLSPDGLFINQVIVPPLGQVTGLQPHSTKKIEILNTPEDDHPF